MSVTEYDRTSGPSTLEPSSAGCSACSRAACTHAIPSHTCFTACSSHGLDRSLSACRLSGACSASCTARSRCNLPASLSLRRDMVGKAPLAPIVPTLSVQHDGRASCCAMLCRSTAPTSCALGRWSCGSGRAFAMFHDESDRPRVERHASGAIQSRGALPPETVKPALTRQSSSIHVW